MARPSPQVQMDPYSSWVSSMSHNLLLVDIAVYQKNPMRHLGWLRLVRLLQIYDHHSRACQASRKSVCRKGIFQLPSILPFPFARCPVSLGFDLWLWQWISEEQEMHEAVSKYKKETVLISYSTINGLALKASDSFQLTKPKFSPRK